MIDVSESLSAKWFRRPVMRLKRFSLADIHVENEALVDALTKTELFCNASPDFLKGLLESMSVRAVRAGHVILRQGRRDDSLVLLASGEAEVKRARAGDRVIRQLAVVSKPAAFGEEALMGAGIRSVSVSMLSDGFVLRIRQSDFARLVSESAVDWVDDAQLSGITSEPIAWIWLGDARSRPSALGAATMAVCLDRLRQRLSELDSARHYLCCGRDDSASALAAFLLTQRGFRASAIRGGKRAASTIAEGGRE
jgi:CRP-like cAMP-binding protein